MTRYHKKNINEVTDCSALKITINIPMTLVQILYTQCSGAEKRKKNSLKKRKKLKDPETFPISIWNFSSEIALPDLNFEANLPKSRGESFKGVFSKPSGKVHT